MSGLRPGVLLMAHGTPASAGDIAGFYTHIRGGRAPSDAEQAELQRRYEAIGGLSPLAQRTAAQADGLRRALADAGAPEVVVVQGNKHAAPMIEEAAETLVSTGVSTVVGLVLAPHFASRSIGEYHERARAAIDGRVPYAAVDSWHDEPELIALLADRVGEVAPSGATLIVTAHSLPIPALTPDDPYVAQVTRTAELVAAATGAVRFRVAWQSGGRGNVAWLEPDVRDVIVEEADLGAPAVVVCPAGFTAEHLEVAYDLDIEAAAVAESKGVAFSRTRSLDDDPRLCAMLAKLVRRAAP